MLGGDRIVAAFRPHASCEGFQGLASNFNVHTDRTDEITKLQKKRLESMQVRKI